MNGAKYLIFCFFLTGCAGKEKQTVTEKRYFDLKSYFDGEAARLRKENTAIEKTVSQNNKAETKTLQITDWGTELELFSSSDINKPAWRDSYKITRSKNSVKYISADEELRTSKIFIKTDSAGTISHISIINKTDNALYSSIEELIYIPDSLYSIKKEQHVLIIGDNSFSISGKFGKL